jgi:hypothetical protein
MAVITYGTLLRVQNIFTKRKGIQKKALKGLTDLGKRRVNDAGYTKKEAKANLARLTQLQQSLPKLDNGGSGPNRKPKLTLDTKIKLNRAAAKAVKIALTRTSALDAKLKRPVNIRLGSKRPLARERIQEVRHQLLGRLQQLGDDSSKLSQSRRAAIRHRLRHLVPLAKRTVGVKGKIYKVTNVKTGKVYIGQTVSTVAKRFNEHLVEKQTRFDRVLSRKTVKNFKVETIATATTRSKLDRLEKQFIAKFDSTNPRKGYNTQPGKYGANTAKRVRQLSNVLLTTKNPTKIKKIKNFLRKLNKRVR